MKQVRMHFFEWASLSSKHCANLNSNVYKLTLSHCKLALKLQVEVDLWEGQKTKTL